MLQDEKENLINENKLLQEDSVERTKMLMYIKSRQITFKKLLSKLFNKIEEYKLTQQENLNNITLMECYGFALALNQFTNDNLIKKEIESKVIACIETFVLHELRKSKGLELSNLMDNFEGFKKRLRLIRLKLEKFNTEIDLLNFLEKIHVSLEELINDIFEFIIGVLGAIPESCPHVFLSTGSLATRMSTPYSDISYIILLESLEKGELYFSGFADLFELMIIGFGESPISKAKFLLEEFQDYFQYIKKGIRINQATHPNYNNRRLRLINTPKALVEGIPTPTKIIYEPHNHTTAALLTVGLLGKESNKSMYGDYINLFNNQLQTNDTYKACLKKLLQEGIRACKHTAAEIEIVWREQTLDDTVEIKAILLHIVHLPRIYALLLKSLGIAITIESNFFVLIDTLVKIKYLEEKQKKDWTAMVKELFTLRLQLQFENNSSEAKISYLKLNKIIRLEKIIEILQEITSYITAQLSNIELYNRNTLHGAKGRELIEADFNFNNNNTQERCVSELNEDKEEEVKQNAQLVSGKKEHTASPDSTLSSFSNQQGLNPQYNHFIPPFQKLINEVKELSSKSKNQLPLSTISFTSKHL